MKVTLITGASSGIGEAFARQLAAENHHLLLVARSEQKLRSLCGELAAAHGISAHYIAIDLTLPGADARVYEETEKRGLQVEWLINNAGIGSAGDFTTLGLQSELDMMQLNMQALVALTHRFLPAMRSRNRGTIVNVASLAAFIPSPFMAVYAATKVFVRSFTEALIAENQPFNVQIMLLCPGLTETNFFTAAHMNAAERETISNNGTVQTPAEVVQGALRGLKRRKKVVISGTRNAFLVRLGAVVPWSMVAAMLARSFRARFQSTENAAQP